MTDDNWGDDARRVRPLPPDRSDPAPPPPAEERPWMAWTLAGILVVAVVAWAAWPGGGDDRPAARAAVTATSFLGLEPVPTVTAPPPTSTPAPPDQRIIDAETVLGDMTWERIRPLGSAAVQWLTNPVWARDGGFAVLAGAERLTILRSEDGRAWDSTPTNFEPANVERLELVATGEAFYAYGYGFNRPRVWHSPNGVSWTEIDLPRPRLPTIGPLEIFWDPIIKSAPLPDGGAIVWSGAWVSIDWHDVLADFEVFDIDVATGRLSVLESENGPTIEMTYTIEGVGDSVHVTVRRADGTPVRDLVATTGGLDAELIAATLQPGGQGGVWRPAAWIVTPAGAAQFVEPDVPGLPNSAATWITATDDGIVAGSTLLGDALNQVPGVLVRSDDGLTWEMLPGDALPAGALVAGAASDGDVMILAGTSWRTVQLADQITARRQEAVSFRSDDGRTWVEHDAGFPVGAFDLEGVGGGPLGFTVVDLACPGVCSYQAWVSPDGTEWTRVALPGAQLGDFFQIAGSAVGTDAIVVLGADLDGFDVFSNIRVWAGTVNR